MKKILLLALPLMAMCFASCEKNNGNELSGDDIINFEDAHFLQALLYIQEIEVYDVERGWYNYLVDVDRNRDGQISVKEAQDVIGLYLYNNEPISYIEPFNVYSMPEIKYFTALTNLDCSCNQLITLDLSKNTALTYLYCSWNYQLTSLDLSKNTELRFLYCDDNQLTSLDLSKNMELEHLSCSGNPLTKIILNKNNKIHVGDIQDIISEYGDIIEYVD